MADGSVASSAPFDNEVLDLVERLVARGYEVTITVRLSAGNKITVEGVPNAG